MWFLILFLKMKCGFGVFEMRCGFRVFFKRKCGFGVFGKQMWFWGFLKGNVVLGFLK
jgi:hypothetical protein